MKIAIPVHENNVATVADFADRLLLVDVSPGRPPEFRGENFAGKLLPAKVTSLVNFKVDVLICGALSRPLAAMTVHSGIELIPFISGSIEDVLEAYMSGELGDQRFLMPGCTRAMEWVPRAQCSRRRWRCRQQDAASGGGTKKTLKGDEPDAKR